MNVALTLAYTFQQHVFNQTEMGAFKKKIFLNKFVHTEKQKSVYRKQYEEAKYFVKLN